ncbi:hypothetical protein ACVYGN_001413 [Vibrio parahaemolyticus]
MFFESPFFWTFAVSIAAFFATEFFFPVEDGNPQAKKQKHFWSIAFFIVISGQGLVLSQLFENSSSIDAKLVEFDSKVTRVEKLVAEKAQGASTLANENKKHVVAKVEEFSNQTNEQYNKIDTSIQSFNGIFGSIAGIEEVTKYEKIRILVNHNVEDTLVVYDSSSDRFPILEDDKNTDYWVRLTNSGLISKPVVELRISPQPAQGKESGTEFVFGVSQRVIQILSGGSNEKQLRVDAKIVKKST